MVDSMEQKHIDEMENSFFGEETIDDDYPILKVEEKKEEKKKEKKDIKEKEFKEFKEEKKAAPIKTIKSTPQIHISNVSKPVRPKEPEWETEREEEILITPARMNMPLKEVVKENKFEAKSEYKPLVKPEIKPENKPEFKPLPPIPELKSTPSADPDKNKKESVIIEGTNLSSSEISSGSGWKWFIFLLIIVIIAAFLTHGFGFYSPTVSTNIPGEEISLANTTENLNKTTAAIPSTKTPTLPVTTEKGTELTLLAKRWMFNPNTLYVKAGENIKLTVKATDLDFVFSIPDLGVQSSVSGITLVEFTPAKAGTYTFKCSSCDSWRGMEGKLIVK
ncbi:MAG: cupredoxin domain-containing protein [Candidatus Woesearchaeota archaeon]